MIDYLDLARETDEGCVDIGQYLASFGPADKNASTRQNHMKVSHRLRVAGPSLALTDHVMHSDGTRRSDPGISQHY